MDARVGCESSNCQPSFFSSNVFDVQAKETALHPAATSKPSWTQGAPTAQQPWLGFSDIRLNARVDVCRIVLLCHRVDLVHLGRFFKLQTLDVGFSNLHLPTLFAVQSDMCRLPRRLQTLSHPHTLVPFAVGEGRRQSYFSAYIITMQHQHYRLSDCTR